LDRRCLFVWPCVYYSVYWLSIVFYRAKVEPAIDVAFKQSDSTPIGDDAADTASSPSSSIRTRKLFPETWLWENVYVTGYLFFQSYLRNNQNKLHPSVSQTHTHTRRFLVFQTLLIALLVMDSTNKKYIKAFSAAAWSRYLFFLLLSFSKLDFKNCSVFFK